MFSHILEYKCDGRSQIRAQLPSPSLRVSRQIQSAPVSGQYSGVWVLIVRVIISFEQPALIINTVRIVSGEWSVSVGHSPGEW